MKNSLRWQWFYQKRIYLLVFIIPVFIMFTVYSLFGVHPFGKESVLVLDLNGQYVYYFEALRDAIWGDNSLIYSWSRNLSGEMFGIFGYYLASPFTIIPILLPRSMMLYSIEIMELFKVGACAITFAVYLKNRKSRKPFTLLIFATTYALMGYVVVELMNPMWIDGLIYLPLIFMGVEKLIDDKKMLNLIIPLGLMFIANFYIGYMIGIFTAIYFVYYYFYREDRLEKKDTFKAIGRFAISAVVAIMCSMVVILPVYKSLQLGKLDFTDPDFSIKTQFTFVEFLTKLLPFSYDTVRPEGLPMIYSGVFTLMLIPLYFMNRNIKSRHKCCNALFLTLTLIIMYVKPIDMVLHGFQVPNWLPFRYSFIFSAFLIIMAAEAFEHMEGITKREIGGTFVAFLAFIVYLESQNFDHINPFGAIVVSLICIVTYFFLLNALKKRNDKNMQISVLIFVCCELFASSLMTVIDIDDDVVYSNYSTYKGYIETGREVVDEIEEQDDSFYRTEKTFHRTVNDAMAFGMRGISHSSSTMNAPVIDLISELGFASRGHYTKYKGATKITDAFFGIKYVMNKDQDVYDYTEKLQHDNITVYENPNALSVGFMANNAVRDIKISGDNPFMSQNILFSSLLADETQAFFKRIFVDDILYDNVSVGYTGNHVKYTPSNSGQTAQIEFKIIAPSDDIIYAYFPTSYERKMSLYVNDKSMGTYFETDNHYIVPIGKFSEGEEISIKMTLKKDEAYMIDQYFYYIDSELFDTAMETLKQEQWNITKYSETYLEGDITANQDQIMMTTIPYQEGWTIKVDGKETQPVKLVDSLIGIEVPEGTHTVTMKFLPTYFIVGIIISIAGLICIVVIGILQRRSRNILLNRLYK